jgi:transposase
MLTIGLDVHQSSSSLCVLDPQGNTQRQIESKGGWDNLIATLTTIKEPFQIVYEASAGYGALYQRLSALPLAKKVVVANPNRVRLIFQSTRKSNRADAARLASLLHLNQVPRIHVPEQEVRSWRGLIEHRRMLVDRRVAAKNQIRALLRTFHIKAPRRLWTKQGVQWLRTITWPTAIEPARMAQLLDLCATLSRLSAACAGQLDVLSSGDPRIELLQSIPGVGPRTAEAFVAYVDNPHRFKSHAIGAYFGLVPREDSTGDKRRLGHITHEGPGTVRKYLAQSAWRGIQDSPTLRAVYDRMLRNDKHRKKIALVGLCHWLCRVMLAMLQSGEAFKESAVTPLSKAPNPAAEFLNPPAIPPADQPVTPNPPATLLRATG